jgi:FlgD Ig-like domain
MKTPIWFHALIASIALISTATTAFGAWLANGSPVVLETNGQTVISIVSDGVGGTIIIWLDGRDGDPFGDLYAQRLNAVGTPLWTIGGVPVCSHQFLKHNPNAISDGVHGAIIVWEDYRNGDYDIYAQRIDVTGNPVWTVDGVPVCTATNLQYVARPVLFAPGEAIITWFDRRSGTDFDVYAQRLDSAGSPVWATDGVVVSAEPFDQEWPAPTRDEAGGVIIAWEDNRNGSYRDIYAQRLTGSGSPLWTAGGVAVCTAAWTQEVPAPVPDGSGGAIIGWGDTRASSSGPEDVYAQRIDRDGTPLWTMDGVVVCNAAGDQSYPFVVSDGAGGAIMCWSDERAGISGSPDIYAQRVSPTGSSVWTANGAPVCTERDPQFLSSMVADGAGGIVVAWTDYRNPSPDIYAQRLDSFGAGLWTGDGEAFCTASGIQNGAGIAVDAGGCVILAWTDQRGSDADVYALSNSACVPTGVRDRTPAASVTVSEGVPNPFSGATQLRVSLSEPSAVQVDVFDVSGHRVYSYDAPRAGAGSMVIPFRGRDMNGTLLPNGVYFARVRVAGTSVTRKLTIVR